MSAPFGLHPTFAEYCVWAKDQGCSFRSGIRHIDGVPVGVTVILSPSNERVVTSLDTNEYLTPTEIGRFDRRLKLKSPWFSVEPR